MLKIRRFPSLVVVALVSLMLALPAQAGGRHRSHSHGGAIVGGLALGLIVGSALSNRDRDYYDDRYYDDGYYYDRGYSYGYAPRYRSGVTIHYSDRGYRPYRYNRYNRHHGHRHGHRHYRNRW